jgi:hypothetical protein
MRELLEQTIDCPYCGENIDVLIDQSEERQDYIEDCQVCCRPIRINVSIEPDGGIDLSVSGENE